MPDELLTMETWLSHSMKLEGELEKLGLKIKHHEDNLQILLSQMKIIDETILDLKVGLGEYHAGAPDSFVQTERQTVECILRQEKAAAGIICKMKLRHAAVSSGLTPTKDVLGVVATLGKVSDDNLSRLFSEFLGLETMLGLVCKTYEGVKALENYDKEGVIDKNNGLHGLGLSVGKSLHGRYLVFCLELMRPYVGEFVADDPEKKLALLKPRLPNGECPPGFLGFAVNMINVDHIHVSCLTAGGHGLRETLFYTLFSRLQVYKTRVQMLVAMPFISDGAVSLDGGMIKSDGLFFLGDRKNVNVRFPVSTGVLARPDHVADLEEKLKLLDWRKESLLEGIKRENTVLGHVKDLYRIKRHEFTEYLNQGRLQFSQSTNPMLEIHEDKVEILKRMVRYFDFFFNFCWIYWNQGNYGFCRSMSH